MYKVQETDSVDSKRGAGGLTLAGFRIALSIHTIPPIPSIHLPTHVVISRLIVIIDYEMPLSFQLNREEEA